MNGILFAVIQAEFRQDFMVKQEWQCDGCKATGLVKFEEHAGATEVLIKILDDHKATGALSCPTVFFDFARTIAAILYPQEKKG